uniref:uncharacterized protein isoform X2 n=1 Tax=Semicossyphus pulcher TaxID=241346 RepID=UPI0037E759D7
MAGRLLIVVFMYSFSELKAQALVPPKLTVNPAVITETDSVTLYCQTPSPLPLIPCYFRTMKGRPAKELPCQHTVTGTELLKITHQSSPAEVKVTCSYLHGSESPQSDVSSIVIRTSLPPKLTVNPPVINETDSVTLLCQPPPYVSESQCHFNTSGGGPGRVLSCLQTLTGTELLKMAHHLRSSPAEVKLTCFYTVKLGKENSPSPRSATSSITIHSQKPQLTLQHFPGEYVLFTCSLPGSANPDTRCNLYFGETSRPVKTTIQSKTTRKNKQSFCQFIVTIDDLLSRLHLVHQRDASCDYRLSSEPDSLSPRSDGYSLTDIVRKESHMAPTMLTITMTTGLTVGTQSNSGTCVSTFLTTVNSPSETWKWKWVVTSCGVTVGVTLLGLALLRGNRRTEDFMFTSNLDHGGLTPAAKDETYSVMTYVPGADRPAGSEKLKMKSLQMTTVMFTTFTPPSLKTSLHQP